MSKVVVPKLINLNATTVRNNRTLIWLQNQDPTVNWSKWDAVVSSIEAYKYWSQKHAKIVGIVLTNYGADINLFIDELFEISKHVPMILLSQQILSAKSQEFWDENFDNILNLNNILEQYPYIEKDWEGTDSDGINIISILLRYNQIVDCPLNEGRTCMSMISRSNIKPAENWAITQFFRHSSNRRHREIKECLKRNCECPHIDKIVLLVEKDYSDEYKNINGAEKIQQVIIGRRLTYADFLRYVHETIPNNVHVMLCNADIYFGDSLIDLHKINMNDKMLGLLRWDVDEQGEAKVFGPRADSQDTWIFLSDSIKNRTWDYSKFNFQLGQAGCDNAFAGLILRNRFLVVNPALSFKTFHLHNTNIRNYDKKDYIRADFYVNIVPTFIIDFKQETIPIGEKPSMISNELASFEIKSSSMSNEITYCTMLEKEGRYKWEPSVENHYFEAAIPLYKWNKVCVSPNGLVYSLLNIYVGKHHEEDKYNYWANTNISILTPLQKRDKMLAIPFINTDLFKHPDRYILNYISRCVRLLKDHPEAAFWIPKEFTDYLDYFQWGVPNLNGVYFDENTACWADEVVGFLPGPEGLELGIEDVAALRGIYPAWIETPTPKTCSIVISSDITQEFVEGALTTFLLNKDPEWSIRFVRESDYASYDSLLGSSLCIFIGGKNTQGAWSKLWALPKDCRVIEFQQELKIDGEFQHLAHVAGFKSWILLLSKGSKSDVQQQILEQLEKWFKKNEDEFAT